MTTPATGDQGGERSLGSKVRRGLGWSFANMIVGRMGIFLTGVIMARLLTPEDYGVFAVALVALTALLSVNDLGIILSLVRWPGDLEEIAPTAATVSLLASLLAYAVCYLGAPWFAEVQGAPEATGVLRLLCLAVVIDGFTAVPSAVLTRQFRQGQRMLSDFASLFVATGVQVWLALDGYGAWSLAWGRLAGNAVGAVLLLVMASGGFRFGWEAARAKALLRFSLPLVGSTVLTFAMLNLDKMVVGALLDTTALGLYTLAFNLSSWPVNVFSKAVRRVSLAGFSQLTDDPPGLRSAFNRSSGLLLAATLPVCVLLGTLAVPAITFVYGPQWEAGADALRWLSVLGAVRVLGELAYDYLIALGRSAATMWLQGLWTAALLPALAGGALTAGLAGVGIGHAVVALLVVCPAIAWTLHRAGHPPLGLLVHLLLPLAGGAVLAAVSLAVDWLVDGTFVVLALSGVLGGLAYLGVIAPMRHMLRQQRPVPAPADTGAAASGA